MPCAWRTAAESAEFGGRRDARGVSNVLRVDDARGKVRVGVRVGIRVGGVEERGRARIERGIARGGQRRDRAGRLDAPASEDARAPRAWTRAPK